MTATAAGKNLLAAEIVLPLARNWTAEIQVDAAAALSGAVPVVIDGITFNGTVAKAPDGTDESVIEGGRCLCRIVGGAGGLTTELDPRAYVGTTVRGVVSDILREAGETLSTTADAPSLSTSLAKWQRDQGSASEALTAVVDAAGATWRVLLDGTIWIGTETWPTVAPKHVVIDRPSPVVIAIALGAPELVPGVTFLGHKVRQVVHYLSGKLRTDVYIESIADTFDRLFAPLRRAIDYSRAWPSRIVKQNADKTLQVLPDDERMRGSGLDKVPIRRGLPGITDVQVESGRCTLEFEAGDPKRPIVTAFEPGAVTKVEFDNGTKSIARVDDAVHVTIPIGTVVIAASGATLNPAPITLDGTIDAGNDKLKA